MKRIYSRERTHSSKRTHPPDFRRHQPAAGRLGNDVPLADAVENVVPKVGWGQGDLVRYAEMLVEAAPHDSEALELAALGKRTHSNKRAHN